MTRIQNIKYLWDCKGINTIVNNPLAIKKNYYKSSRVLGHCQYLWIQKIDIWKNARDIDGTTNIYWDTKQEIRIIAQEYWGDYQWPWIQNIKYLWDCKEYWRHSQYPLGYEMRNMYESWRVLAAIHFELFICEHIECKKKKKKCLVLNDISTYFAKVFFLLHLFKLYVKIALQFCFSFLCSTIYQTSIGHSFLHPSWCKLLIYVSQVVQKATPTIDFGYCRFFKWVCHTHNYNITFFKTFMECKVW